MWIIILSNLSLSNWNKLSGNIKANMLIAMKVGTKLFHRWHFDVPPLRKNCGGILSVFWKHFESLFEHTKSTTSVSFEQEGQKNSQYWFKSPVVTISCEFSESWRTFGQLRRVKRKEFRQLENSLRRRRGREGEYPRVGVNPEQTAN